MGKIVKINNTISDVKDKTALDEKWINNLAVKTSAEILSILKGIDEESDKKLESLNAEKRLKIEGRINELKEQRNEIYHLLNKATEKEQKEKLLNAYLDTVSEERVLFAASLKETDNNAVLVIKQRKNRKIAYIAAACIPLAVATVYSLICKLSNNK